MCALKPKSTPSPVEEAVKELEHLWNNRNDGGGLDSSYDEFEALLRSLAASVRRETLDRAIELIPNKKYPDDGNGDNDDQNYGRNKVIDEFRSSLEQEKGGTP